MRWRSHYRMGPSQGPLRPTWAPTLALQKRTLWWEKNMHREPCIHYRWCGYYRRLFVATVAARHRPSSKHRKQGSMTAAHTYWEWSWMLCDGMKPRMRNPAWQTLVDHTENEDQRSETGSLQQRCWRISLCSMTWPKETPPDVDDEDI